MLRIGDIVEDLEEGLGVGVVEDIGIFFLKVRWLDLGKTFAVTLHTAENSLKDGTWRKVESWCTTIQVPKKENP